MNAFFQVFYAVFSGILTSLAIPNEFLNFGSPLFGMIALVPLYIAVKEAKTYRRAALLFGLDALTTHLLSSFWLANFKDFAIFTLGASAAGTFCIEAMAGCLFFAPFAQKTSSRQEAVRSKQASCLIPLPTSYFLLPTPLWFSCIRVVYEWAKSTGFLAYPWGTLYMSAYRSKAIMQSADIFGVYGITFLFAFIAGTIGETIYLLEVKQCKKLSRREPCSEKGFRASLVQNFFSPRTPTPSFLHCLSLIKCSVAILACFFVYGAFRLNQTREPIKTLNAVLVQANKDSWAASESQGDIEAIENSMRITEDGIKKFKEQGIEPDIVVWSEAVLLYPFPHAYINYAFRPEEESLIDFIKRSQTPFLIGGAYIVDDETYDVANAALVFDKDGKFNGWYGKNHLVPFAEAVPGTQYELVRNLLNKIVGFSNGWTPGGNFNLFNVNDVCFATPICFEDAFPEICGTFHKNGAEVFLNITDDSWSKTNSAEYQHFVVASFRAIEYRTTLVRSCNAGFTTVVDPCGRILQSLPLFEEAHLCANIPIYQHQETLYSRFTNWFVYLVMAFMLFVYFNCAIMVGKQDSNFSSAPAFSNPHSE